MKRRLESLTDREHDVLVIGGGITGAFLALDAATRGARVALIDRADFGGETSAASSKLLHGGLRYLQQLRFGKARESAQERLLFQNLVPHLVHYVPFVVPTYPGLARSRAVLATGMRVYETLCLGQRHLLLDPARAVPEGRGLDAGEVRALVPGLGQEVTGGRLFYESHMRSSERVTLAVVDGAVQHDAAVANYVEAVDFLRGGDSVRGVRARDVEDGRELEIRARLTLNAAGPWIGDLDARLGAGTGQLTGFSRGAHIVTRPLTEGHAVALPTRRRADTVIDRGGRHVFVIPWRGHSLIGTSYGPHEGPLEDVRPLPGEVDALIDDINGALGPGTLSRDDVRYAFAGLYPLTADEIDPDRYQGSSDYLVVDHAEHDGIDGVATVFGAKFTTARLLAELALDRLLPRLQSDWGPCRTRTMTLPSAPAAPGSDEPEPGTLAHDLLHQHGARAATVAALAASDPALQEPLAADRGTRAVDVVWAAREEMARSLDDVVFRRTGLGTLGHPGAEALRHAATLLASELSWDGARIATEIDRVEGRFAW